MNLVLLGNGFDLNLNLPTSYIDFLDTMNYVWKHECDNYKTIADLWNREELQAHNKRIGAAYNRYKEIYEDIMLPDGFLNKMKSTLEKNLWFHYLLNSVNKNIGWIDFEQEIKTVVRSLNLIFKHLHEEHIDNSSRTLQRNFYIVSQFNIFIEGREPKYGNTIRIDKLIKKDFLIEYPIGSNCLTIDKEKIISHVFCDLEEFVDILQEYLKIFIDGPFEKITDAGIIEDNRMFGYTDRAVTLNYTHSFEKLYPSVKVFHLHGEIGKKIVLGIASDENDSEDFINTDFIMFKKYFQRVIHGTDEEYLSFLQNIKNLPKKMKRISLTVMGHSLDVSDRDIIVELFNVSDSITILYHCQSALETYVRNLVRIFGKRGLDELRATKDLKFCPLSKAQLFTTEQGMETFFDVLEQN